MFEKPKQGSRSEEEAEIKEALRTFDFFVFETLEPNDGRQIYTYPFEDREENIEKINAFVENLKKNYECWDIELSDEGSLGHYGRELPARQFYMIIINAQTQNENK